MHKILITGGSGLLGRELTKLLHAGGHEVAWLSRKKTSPSSKGDGRMPERIFQWDIARQYIDPEALLWSDVLIHLAGEGIAEKRWTNARKQVIIESRTRTTQLLVDAMAALPTKKHIVIAASAIGYYGPSTDERVETDAAGEGFLAYSVNEWEKATAQFRNVALRTVILRIGIVLAPESGAYPELLLTKWMRVLPLLGGGAQMYPWIHIKDVTRIMQFAIDHPLDGVYNAVSPNPVSQGAIMKTYSRVKGGYYLRIPAPTFVLRLILGEMADMVLLTQQVSAKKIMDAGYQFVLPDIHDAIVDLEKK